MSVLVTALFALHVVTGITTISGQVVGADGTPIPHAQVFLEPGLGGLVADTVTDMSGEFQFPDVSPGPAGIFAVAPGLGFEGQHLNVAVADVIPPVRLTLRPATQIKGTISSHDGKALQGARITRIGVKGANKVGVPLAKLMRFGYAEPQSDENGRFVLDNVPQGCLVDLKVGHPNYAQEGISDIAAGTHDVRIAMYPGVLVEGVVVSRANKHAVAQVSVLIQNAQPPHDTALARSGLQGTFSMRLKPGVYLYQAAGAGVRSPGWERLTITGEKNIEHMRLAVAGTGKIRGSVRDAITGEPLRDVRISLQTNGTGAEVVRTGPDGDFQFEAGEGENIVRVDSIPGYFPPESQDIKVSVLEDIDVELPGMWLKPLPAYAVTIVDEAGSPVPGALVTLVRPAQFGWHVADTNGRVALRIQSFPESGSLLGRVEHPTRAMGAIFSLERAQNSPGTVQLFPLSTVTGKVVNNRGRGVGGAVVGAFFPGEPATDAALLWSTVSGGDGTFTWNAAIPGVPQRCVARTGENIHGESMTFNLAPEEEEDLGKIVVKGGKSTLSQRGEVFSWKSLVPTCVAAASLDTPLNGPALILYTSLENLPSIAESALQIKNIVAHSPFRVVVVVDGVVDCNTPYPVPVYQGTAPSVATAVVVNSVGKVILESMDLPPAMVLRASF